MSTETPSTECVEWLYIKFDFDMAQQKLVECEKVHILYMYSTCICACTCMCMCMCIVHVHVYVHCPCTCTCTHVGVCLHMYDIASVCVRVFTCVRTVHVNEYMCICTCFPFLESFLTHLLSLSLSLSLSVLYLSFPSPLLTSSAHP